MGKQRESIEGRQRITDQLAKRYDCHFSKEKWCGEEKLVLIQRGIGNTPSGRINNQIWKEKKQA
jgi:hypothetical protein